MIIIDKYNGTLEIERTDIGTILVLAKHGPEYDNAEAWAVLTRPQALQALEALFRALYDGVYVHPPFDRRSGQDRRRP